MRYVKVVDGFVNRVYTGPLGWLKDDGSSLTDVEYIMGYGIYPLIENGGDGLLETDISMWIVDDASVSVVYYTLTDIYPDDQRITKIVSVNSTSEWIYDDTELTARVTYGIVERTGEEISALIEITGFRNPDSDADLYEVKPENQWLYDGTTIIKTYWSIVQDPARLNYSDILYDVVPTDRSTWLSNDVEIFEVCNFAEKSNQDAKSLLRAYIADYRWQIEVGGYTYNTYNIYTDRESQTKLLTKYTFIKNGVITGDRISWKTEAGFIGFDIVDFENMCIAVGNFVDQCYMNELALYEELEAQETFGGIKDVYDKSKVGLIVEGSTFVMGL